MNRHAKQLQSKSRVHIVELIDPSKNLYRVTSGTSGNQYLVNIFTDGGGGCNCDWSTKRPAVVNEQRGISTCSHVIAVLNFRQKENWNTISAWASPEQAQAQHRTVINAGDGILLTVRKHRKVYSQLQFAF